MRLCIRLKLGVQIFDALISIVDKPIASALKNWSGAASAWYLSSHFFFLEETLEIQMLIRTGPNAVECWLVGRR